MPFEFRRLQIPEVVLVQGTARDDARGSFMETYKRSEFERGGVTPVFVQDNYSRSLRGVFRGLHWQNPPGGQGKLVCAVRGEILDFAVDIRKGSPTYARWVAEVLSDVNHRLLYVPAGFAHGFLTLSDSAEVLQKVTSEYSPAHDRGAAYDDPRIGLRLPAGDVILSEKDAAQPLLSDADNGFAYGE